MVNTNTNKNQLTTKEKNRNKFALVEFYQEYWLLIGFQAIPIAIIDFISFTRFGRWTPNRKQIENKTSCLKRRCALGTPQFRNYWIKNKEISYKSGCVQVKQVEVFFQRGQRIDDRGQHTVWASYVRMAAGAAISAVPRLSRSRDGDDLYTS